VDLLIIAETKLDQSFPDAQFKVDNFHIWRKDRNGNGGGLVIYLQSELACDRKKTLECETIESIAVELLVNGKQWLISGMYRPQTISDNEFINDFTKTYDKISVKYDNMIFLGDLNYDLLSVEKGTPLNTVCDSCGIENNSFHKRCNTYIK
jgi:exonuclease III